MMELNPFELAVAEAPCHIFGRSPDPALDVDLQLRYSFFSEVIRRSAGTSQSIVVADVGCGSGHGTALIRELTGAKVLGLDRWLPCISYARARYDDPAIHFRPWDLHLDRLETLDHLVFSGWEGCTDSDLERLRGVDLRGRWLLDLPIGLEDRVARCFSGCVLHSFWQGKDGTICSRSAGSNAVRWFAVIDAPGSEMPSLDIPSWDPGQFPPSHPPRPFTTIEWVPKSGLLEALPGILLPADSVLDIGCGIRPQRFLTSKIHICWDPYLPYLQKARENITEADDRSWLFIQADWREACERFPSRSVDTVFLLDVIEHVPKADGRALLARTLRIARKQVVVFTPLGFMPQHHPDGVDAWGMLGGAYQEHQSGWLPEDFGEGWRVLACSDFHGRGHSGNSMDMEFGAILAIADARRAEDPARFKDPLRMHWEYVFEDLPELAGTGSFETISELLGLGGPFIDDFANAMAFLDIGPGPGALLLGSKAKVRAGYDCSLRALERLAILSNGAIEGFSHHDRPSPGAFDLVTCTSVVPYCALKDLRRVLAIAWDSLAPGGRFYLQGIGSTQQAAATGFDLERLRSGGHFWAPENIAALWMGSIEHTTWIPTPEPEPDGLYLWVMRLGKGDVGEKTQVEGRG